MNESDLPLIWWTAGVLSAVLSWLLAGLILRSACDLCSVEPPGYLKSLIIVPAIFLIVGAIAFGLLFGGHYVERQLGWPGGSVLLWAVLLALPIGTAVAAALYVPVLRVRFVKGISIWGWQLFITAVIYGVLVLLLIGGISTFEGFRRLS